MINGLKTIGKILTAIAIMVNTAMPANASLVFTNDVFQNEANIFRIGQGYDTATSDMQLQFGTTNTETFMWDYANTAFKFSDDVNFDSNQMLAARIENADGSNSLPGGAVGLGVGGRGRIVQLTGVDTVAPGCTISPNCGGGTYVWDGGTWISLTGTTSSNFNKLITVGSTGCDYTTIANGAAYLQTLSGGIMLLSAETHAVTTAVNMTNLIIIGKEASRTTVNISGAGQLDSYDTTYEYLTLSTGAITDDMAIDVQTGSNALLFNYVDINIQDAGDSLIDSNAGTAPTTTMKFIKSNMAGGSGTILKTKALSNLNTASAIYIDSRSSDTPLQMSDWDLTLAGGGSVNTSGIISPVPADSIIVSPNMNLQGAIDSLEYAGRGGLITLLPGTYNISAPLTIEDDGIEMVGYGDSSVINASGFTGGVSVAAIQVGTADGTAAKSDVVLKDFKLLVTGTGASDIHGIRVNGGEDIRIDNVTVEKISGASGSGATARIGIQMIDAAAGCTGTCILTRPVITKSRVLGTSGVTAYFTDGIHVTSDPSYPGVSGNNQGVINALVDGNMVDYVGETSYVLVGVQNSSLFNNRGMRMAAGASGYGIFLGNMTNVNMTANVFSGSLNTTAIAVGVESFNLAKQTIDSIINNNIIDGTGNGGVGFGTGFLVGNAANTAVYRNTFQNNIIKGASNGVTIAFSLNGDADDNTVSNNDITGGVNAWDIGINISSASGNMNLASLNRFTNTTTIDVDSGTATRFGVAHHRAAVSPTVNDDAGDSYEVGTVWVNTATDTTYICTDSTVGAAVWQATGGTGATVPTTLPAAQARRTTTYTLTTAFTDITLDTTDLENDATVVDHDLATNSDRIYVYEDGTYLISYDATGGGTATGTHLTYAQVISNDTTVLPGSSSVNRNYQGEYSSNSAVFLANLTANDFVSLQLMRDATADSTQGDIVFSVTKLEGIKGDKGDQGLPGSAGAGTDSNTFTLDTDDTGGNVSLQFGTTLAESLTWNSVSSRFDLSDDLSIGGNLILSSGANEGISGGGLVDCDTSTSRLQWDSTTNKFVCFTYGGPDTGTFTDTTPGSLADNDTTQIFNDATKPNITTDSTSSTVLVSFMVRGTSADADAETDAFRVIRSTDGADPVCGTDPQVGEVVTGYSTDAARIWTATGTFLDSPGVAGEIRYTICSSSLSSSSGDLDTAENVAVVTLAELGN